MIDVKNQNPINAARVEYHAGGDTFIMCLCSNGADIDAAVHAAAEAGLMQPNVFVISLSVAPEPCVFRTSEGRPR